MNLEEMTAGDTLPIVYKHKINDEYVNLPEGYDLIFGLRQENGSSVVTYSYQNNEIENTEAGFYMKRLDHEFSKSLSGTIVIEMVIYSRDGSFVQHCGSPRKVKVLPSFMNEYLDIYMDCLAGGGETRKKDGALPKKKLTDGMTLQEVIDYLDAYDRWSLIGN